MCVRTTCPRCESSDYVDTVANVINGGTHSSMIEGVSFDWGQENVGISTSMFTSTNMSNVATALTPPRKPGPGPLFMTIYIVGSLIGATAIMGNSIYGGSFVGYVIVFPFSAMVGLLIGFGLTLAHKVLSLPFYPTWYSRYRKLMTAKYCYRDSVAFDDKISSGPRGFVRYIFSN